jgi:hypothetical protein
VEDKNLLCDEKTVIGDLAAFMSACDGARECGGECKKAFDTRYAGCVRGYVPMLVDGGFRNATLKRILDLCVPNDRAKPLAFHIEALIDTVTLFSPIQVAALEYAMDVARSDPQLFKGYTPTFTYDVWHAGNANNTPGDRGEEGVDAAAAIFNHGIERTNIVLGMDWEYLILLASRALNKLQIVNIYYTTGVDIASPLKKNMFPYAVGALASGIKILSIFGPILRLFGTRHACAHAHMRHLRAARVCRRTPVRLQVGMK